MSKRKSSKRNKQPQKKIYSPVNSWWVVASCSIVLAIIYSAVFGGFFPNEHGRTGHDFGFVMTRLMAGFYWFEQNGFFAVPWFSPFNCAGTVFFADPQSFYYSVPQFLTFIVEPLTALRATMIGFALIGGSGMYLLLRKAFSLDVAVSGLGAVLFMFNGFFAYRMIIGHATFHGFMLLPLIAALIMWPVAERRRWLGELWLITAAGMAYAYLFVAGAVHLMIPVGLSLVGLILIQAIRDGWRTDVWLRLFAVGFVVVLLGAAKLSAALGTIEHLSRDAYLLPGFKSFFDAVWIPFRLLFFGPSETLESTENLSKLLGNLQWRPDRHSWEYGVSIVPFLLLLAGIGLKARDFVVQRSLPSGRTMLISAPLAMILLIPALVNFYTPEWNALLKQLPVTKASVMLFRWYCVYIPIVIVAAVLVLARLPLSGPPRIAIAVPGMLIAVITHGVTSMEYYNNQPYDPAPLNKAHSLAKSSGEVPEIRKIVAERDANGQLIRSLNRDDVMIDGGSRLACYQALFGYVNEFMVMEPAAAGSIYTQRGGVLNMKNPACYTFPKENSCKPGDHFRTDQRAELTEFAAYRPFAFEMPGYQRIANFVSGFGLLFGLLLLLGYPAWLLLQRVKAT